MGHSSIVMKEVNKKNKGVCRLVFRFQWSQPNLSRILWNEHEYFLINWKTYTIIRVVCSSIYLFLSHCTDRQTSVYHSPWWISYDIVQELILYFSEKRILDGPFTYVVIFVYSSLVGNLIPKFGFNFHSVSELASTSRNWIKTDVLLLQGTSALQ